MGNCVSQAGQKGFLNSLSNTAFDNALLDDPNGFLVYIKKKNKFLPGALKVTEREILFFHGLSDVKSWPFQYLRRYGFTSGGVFFFESGRRCSTGEGLHTFQTCQSEAIFQLVQIRIQESASVNTSLVDPAGQSIVDNFRNACLYRTGRTSFNSRIRPLQRHLSEGVSNCDGTYRSLRVHRHCRYHHKQFHPQPNRPMSFSSSLTARQTGSLPQFVSENNDENQACVTSTPGEIHPYTNFSVQPFSVVNRSEVFNITCVDGYSSSILENLQLRTVCDSPACGEGFFGRYVNVPEVRKAKLEFCDRLEDNSLPILLTLDYASVNISQPCEKDVSQQGAVSCLADDTVFLPMTVNTVDYTEVDLEKTHAAEVATKASELEVSQRHHFSVT